MNMRHCSSPTRPARAGNGDSKQRAAARNVKEYFMAAKTLTINGQQISAEEGATILQAADEAGVKIPTLVPPGRRL